MAYSNQEISQLISESFYPDPKDPFNIFMRARKYFPYTIVKAPSTLSLMRNTNEVIEFFNNIKEKYNKNNKVYIQFNEVTTWDDEALMILLCLLIDFKTSGLQFSGSYPYNTQAKQRLVDSLFHYYVTRKIDYRDNYYFSKNNIDTTAGILCDQKLTSSIIKRASKQVWGEEQRCTGVQGALVELMTNTSAHSSPNKKNAHHFWLTVTPSTNNGVKFLFFDLGAGVLKSVFNKVNSDDFDDWDPKPTHLHFYESNVDLLKLIFAGELCQSLTEEPNIGNGLSYVKTVMDREHISNLQIITNNVSASINTGVYSLLDQNFAGTFLTWEVNSYNKHFKPYNNHSVA